MADVAMADMDIDFDLDEEIDPEIARLNAEAAAFNASIQHAAEQRAKAAESNSMLIEEQPEEGEIDPFEAQPTKVFISGLDKLNANDVKSYVAEYVPSDKFKHVQWINDESANLVFVSEEAAEEALLALSSVEEPDHRMMRSAKRLPTHPGIELEVRQANSSDVKVQNASQYSRFYLDNPEYDPEGRRPRKRHYDHDDGRGERKRFRQRYNDGRGGHDIGTRNQKSFDEDLYDDHSSAPGSKIQYTNSRSSSRSYGRKPIVYEAPEKGRLRDRSASPVGDGDGRYGFSDDQPHRQTARYRSRTPPRHRQRQVNGNGRLSRRTDLFANRLSNTPALNGASNHGARDLFADRVSASYHDHRDANKVAAAVGKYTLCAGPPPDRRLSDNYRPRYIEQDLTLSNDHGRTAKDASSLNRPRELFDRSNGISAGKSAQGVKSLPRQCSPDYYRPGNAAPPSRPFQHGFVGPHCPSGRVNPDLQCGALDSYRPQGFGDSYRSRGTMDFYRPSGPEVSIRPTDAPFNSYFSSQALTDTCRPFIADSAPTLNPRELIFRATGGSDQGKSERDYGAGYVQHRTNSDSFRAADPASTRKPRELISRISDAPSNLFSNKSSNNYGRLNGSDPSAAEMGYSFKGASNDKSSPAQGYSIRGASDKIKELFPDKANLGGGADTNKDLLNGTRIKGRAAAAARRRAEDYDA